MRQDIWLCRVLVRGPRVAQLSMDALQSYYAKVSTGDLACLQDGAIVEPVQQFETEGLAQLARERKLVDEPNTDWRVVVVAVLA